MRAAARLPTRTARGVTALLYHRRGRFDRRARRLQSEVGYWDPTPGLGFALLAHHTRPPKKAAAAHEGAGVLAIMRAAVAGGGDGIDLEDIEDKDESAQDRLGGKHVSEQCPITGAMEPPRAAHIRVYAQRPPRKKKKKKKKMYTPESVGAA